MGTFSKIGIMVFFIGSMSLFGQENPLAFKGKLNSANDLLTKKKNVEALNILSPLLHSKEQMDMSDSLRLYNLLGECNFQMQKYHQAIEYYEMALVSAYKNDTIQADIQYQIGMSKYRLSDYSQAVSSMQKSRNLYKQIFGINDINYTRTLNTLGFLYKIQARYSEAEKTFQEARQISFRLRGGEDIQYARIINNLAIVYCNLNRFDKADELFKTSLRIKEKIGGKINKDYANTLYNIADFYAALGKYDKAKSSIQEGIEIFDSLKETNHPDYLKFRDYLAILTEKTGNIKEAKRLFLLGLSQRENATQTDRDDYALNLMNLGNLLVGQKQYKEAYPYIEKATGLVAKIYGKNHPTYAKVLVTLAGLQSKQNNETEALKNYKSAAQIIQSSLGADNIENFNVQFSYAQFLRKTGKKSEAIDVYKKINKIPQMYLKRATRFLSEKELSDKVHEYLDYVHEIYSFVKESGQDVELCILAYDVSLYYRGFILNSMQHIRLSMAKAQELSSAKDEIISLHRQLEFELNKPISERANTSAIELLISEKEAEIASKIGSFTEEDNGTQWEEVKQSLAEEEAAIEFISFADESIADSIFYGALILKNNLENPIFVSLCRAVELQNLLQVKAGRTSDYIAHIYDFSNRGASAIEEKKKSLYELIWQPLQNHLTGIKKLYVVTDGLLHRVAFSAIPTSLETVVADSTELVFLSSTKYILPNDKKILSYPGTKTLVVGGVNYDSEANELVASRSSNQSTMQWTYLPWAAKESQDVTDILNNGGFQVSYLKGSAATEKAVQDTLNAKDGFRLLHFATHGFFKGNSGLMDSSENNYYGLGMMNSALVFAGVNGKELTGNNNKSDDGLLTAYSISKLDLSHTELVVLSACETALGDLKEVEGVYGMQRAFKLAGANQLILSLWQIPDRETKDFMVSFYKNWLSHKLSIRESFYTTQSEFRKRFVNPYQWAGFVLVE